MTRSVRENTWAEVNAKRAFRKVNALENSALRIQLTCVATYARDAFVVERMPWMRAFPERVALGSWSTELREVKICLKALAVH